MNVSFDSACMCLMLSPLYHYAITMCGKESGRVFSWSWGWMALMMLIINWDNEEKVFLSALVWKIGSLKFYRKVRGILRYILLWGLPGSKLRNWTSYMILLRSYMMAWKLLILSGNGESGSPVSEGRGPGVLDGSIRGWWKDLECW